MADKKKKADKYLTYTAISKACGLTVHQLKMILSKKGYLVANEPTEKALRSKMAVLVEADPENRYFNPKKPKYPKWNERRLVRILERSGHAQDPRFLTTGYHNAADNFCEIGKELALHFGYEDEDCKYQMSYFLDYCLGPDGKELSSNMTHQGVFALSEMYGGDPGRWRKRLEGAFRRADEHEADNVSHLDAARKILDGIEGFLLRQARRR